MLHVHYSQDRVDAAGRVDRKNVAGQRGVFPSQLECDANHICGAGTKSSAVGVHPRGSDSSRQYSAPGFCSRRWRGHEAAGLLLLRLTKWSLLLVAVVCFCSARQVLREFKSPEGDT